MDKQQSRGWCFTINNYTDKDVELFESEDFKRQVRYCIYGFEVGENNTKHIQGFIYFHNTKTFKTVKKILIRAHIEKMKGSISQNVAYCSKDNNFKTIGEVPVKGKRTDLNTIKQAVLSNKPVKQIVEENVNNYQELKFMENLLKYQNAPECKKRIVEWYYGDSGSGKTRKAIEDAKGDYYISMKNLQWWDGYVGQNTIIIDDFRKDFCTYHELLRILDRYPYRVNTKGSSLYLTSDRIIITSCYSPDEVYGTREDINQLKRRIDKVIKFKKEN